MAVKSGQVLSSGLWCHRYSISQNSSWKIGLAIVTVSSPNLCIFHRHCSKLSNQSLDFTKIASQLPKSYAKQGTKAATELATKFEISPDGFIIKNKRVTKINASELLDFLATNRKTSLTSESIKEVATDISSLNIKIRGTAKQVIDKATEVTTAERGRKTALSKPRTNEEEKTKVKESKTTSPAVNKKIPRKGNKGGDVLSKESSDIKQKTKSRKKRLEVDIVSTISPMLSVDIKQSKQIDMKLKEELKTEKLVTSKSKSKKAEKIEMKKEGEKEPGEPLSTSLKTATIVNGLDISESSKITQSKSTFIDPKGMLLADKDVTVTPPVTENIILHGSSNSVKAKSVKKSKEAKAMGTSEGKNQGKELEPKLYDIKLKRSETKKEVSRNEDRWRGENPENKNKAIRNEQVLFNNKFVIRYKSPAVSNTENKETSGRQESHPSKQKEKTDRIENGLNKAQINDVVRMETNSERIDNLHDMIKLNENSNMQTLNKEKILKISSVSNIENLEHENNLSEKNIGKENAEVIAVDKTSESVTFKEDIDEAKIEDSVKEIKTEMPDTANNKGRTIKNEECIATSKITSNGKEDMIMEVKLGMQKIIPQRSNEDGKNKNSLGKSNCEKEMNNQVSKPADTNENILDIVPDTTTNDASVGKLPNELHPRERISGNAPETHYPKDEKQDYPKKDTWKLGVALLASLGISMYVLDIYKSYDEQNLIKTTDRHPETSEILDETKMMEQMKEGEKNSEVPEESDNSDAELSQLRFGGVRHPESSEILDETKMIEQMKEGEKNTEVSKVTDNSEAKLSQLLYGGANQRSAEMTEEIEKDIGPVKTQSGSEPSNQNLKACERPL